MQPRFPLAEPALTEAPTTALEQVSHAAPEASSDISADLERYDIAMVLQPVYEWGGYRYSNASDAIAAAKRAKQ